MGESLPRLSTLYLTPTSGCPDPKGSADAVRRCSYSVLRTDTRIWAWPANNSTSRCDQDSKHSRILQRTDTWSVRLSGRWYESSLKGSAGSILTFYSEFPEEWILKYKDKLIGNKPILRVRDSGDWFNGRLETKECILLDVTVPRDDFEAEASATVALWENEVQASDTNSIPVRYLHPIYPTQLGTTVVIFMGPLAGKQGLIRSIDSDAEVIVVQILEDQVLEDVQKEYMTLCVADHFG